MSKGPLTSPAIKGSWQAVKRPIAPLPQDFLPAVSNLEARSRCHKVENPVFKGIGRNGEGLR